MYLPNFMLQSKLAVVTGATKGIGRAIALAYAEAGADIVLIARSKDGLEQVKEEVEAYGRQAYTISSDIKDYRKIISEVDQLIGDKPIDIWVNNAGINVRSKAMDVTEEEWDQIIDTNMKSSFFLAQAAAKRMDKENPGKIINVSSVGGHVALRTGVVYAMTKSALIQMTKNLAMEWGKLGINVNAIGPWYFPTSLTEKLLEDEDYVRDILDRTPLNRIGKLEELAGTAVFLGSDASNYITGQTLFVDGGMTIYGF
ncbi:SDR family NAD(P)-dependent oxidoreductase [Aquibacillus albus]|uniref:NAD(P)-dependent dehydrogenase (Short-subunit alcohol dehydrogenase family) n=1 Tax=Aquibacillus albus TaxID=1168171 RepID=A0ABS2MVQ7_9BACI|nr:glucose 1-dehydrogenase [Aquibacillus albus]MBM7569873.1 NAD(P)-dependent dehydrogenase (short-subunit alcohol dehydrogenase family) [Aquibacillus albus]